MGTFEVKGTFRTRDNDNQPFSMTIEAISESQAMAKVYARLGGNSQCKHRFVKGVSIVKK